MSVQVIFSKLKSLVNVVLMSRFLQEYRNQMQANHMRKEWDLNDPDTLRKDRPARTSDDDLTLGSVNREVTPMRCSCVGLILTYCFYVIRACKPAEIFR